MGGPHLLHSQQNHVFPWGSNIMAQCDGRPG